MKRALSLLTLWACSLAAFAQSSITVSVSYTPAAAAYAASHSTNVQDMVALALSTANTNYSASSIGVTLVQVGTAAPSSSSAPPDGSAMTTQYAWAKNDVSVWLQRSSQTSSIHVHISDPGALGTFNGITTAGTITQVQDAVAVVPIRALTDVFEETISIIIGSDPAYVLRERKYGYLGGDPWTCLHTRETNVATDPSTPVPELNPNWWVYHSWVGTSTPGPTDAPTREASCEAFRGIAKTQHGTSSFDAASSSVVLVGSAYYCHIWSAATPPGDTFGGLLLQNKGSTGSSPISCTETSDNRYSNGTYPRGDSAHNSVAKMNARAYSVSLFGNMATDRLRRAQSTVWSRIWEFIKSTF